MIEHDPERKKKLTQAARRLDNESTKERRVETQWQEIRRHTRRIMRHEHPDATREELRLLVEIRIRLGLRPHIPIPQQPVVSYRAEEIGLAERVHNGRQAERRRLRIANRGNRRG